MQTLAMFMHHISAFPRLKAQRRQGRVAPSVLSGYGSAGQRQRRISETFDDRAIRSRVAMAVVSKVRQRVAHLRQFRNAAVKIRNVLERNRFHLGAGAGTVLPQRQQAANVLDQKSQAPRLTNKAQRMHFLRSVNPVPGCRASFRRQQADTFVVANHLRCDARCPGRFTDVHGHFPSLSVDPTPSHRGKVSHSDTCRQA